MQIVQAVALVVSGLPAGQRRAGLTALMGPIIEQLQAALQQGRPLSANGALNGGSAGLPHAQPSSTLDLTLVERLTTLFRSAPCTAHYSAATLPGDRSTSFHAVRLSRPAGLITQAYAPVHLQEPLNSRQGPLAPHIPFRMSHRLCSTGQLYAEGLCLGMLAMLSLR